MKNLHTFEEFLNESQSVKDTAYSKIDELPNVEAKHKRINGIFNVSKHAWSEHNEYLKRKRKMFPNVYVYLTDIHITQLDVESIKVKDILDNIDKLSLITIFQLADGEKIIYDGHHRLIAHWALGEKKIKVNLVKI
jgi:hypothetical protein